MSAARSVRKILQNGFGAAAVAAVATLASAQSVSAIPVYDTSVGVANLVGSRSLNINQLETGGTTVLTALTVSWDISFGLGITPWTYSYQMAWLPTKAQAISHTILDLSDNCSSTTNCVVNATLNGAAISKGKLEYGTYDGTKNSNSGMGGPITGVKFDVGSGTPNVISFQSDRAPVWGDIYFKGGNPTTSGWYGQNVGIDNHLSTNILNFVARPDTGGGLLCPNGNPFPNCSSQVTTPEPISMAMLGVGLLGLGAARRWRRAA